MGAVLDKFFGDETLYSNIIKKQSVFLKKPSVFGTVYVNIPDYLPSEVLNDILKYLNRNEVEKCQLVCRRWDRVIDYSAKILPLRLFARLHISKDNRKNVIIYKMRQENEDPDMFVNPQFLIEKLNLLIFEKAVIGPEALTDLEEFFVNSPIPAIRFRLGTSSQRDSEYIPLVHSVPKILKYVSVSIANISMPMKAFIHLLQNSELFQQYSLPIELDIRAFFPYSTPSPIPERTNSFFMVLEKNQHVRMFKCFLYLALCDYKVMDVTEKLLEAFINEWHSGFPFKTIVFEFRNHWNRAPIKRFLAQHLMDHHTEAHNDSRFDVYEMVRDDGWTLNVYLDKVIKLRPSLSDFQFLKHDNEKVLNVLFTECALQ